MYEEYKKDHLARITDDEVLETIAENKDKVVQKHSKSGIIVKGLYDVAVHFSKCCSPVPGDEIVGFVTRGRGVSIHRTDCINIINLSDMERERLIDADADLAAGRHIAADEMCFDKLLTEGESHCMSSYLFEFLTIFFYCSRLLDFCQCFGQ